MYAAGKAARVASEMKRYGLQIIGISESRDLEFPQSERSLRRGDRYGLAMF